MVYDSPLLQPLALYQVSAYAYPLFTKSTGKGWIVVEWFGRRGGRIRSVALGEDIYGQTGGWVSRNAVIQAPRNAYAMGLRLAIKRSKGDILFDNVSISSVPATAPLFGSLEIGNASDFDDPSSAIKAAYSYPNPYVGKPVTFHAEMDQTDQVDIRIFNGLGVKVYDSPLTLRGATPGDRVIYSHQWDASTLSSGVHMYVMEARREGDDRTKFKRGKFAIVK